MNIFNKYPFLIAEIGVNFYDIAEKEEISNRKEDNIYKEQRI